MPIKSPSRSSPISNTRRSSLSQISSINVPQLVSASPKPIKYQDGNDALKNEPYCRGACGRTCTSENPPELAISPPSVRTRARVEHRDNRRLVSSIPGQNKNAQARHLSVRQLIPATTGPSEDVHDKGRPGNRR